MNENNNTPEILGMQVDVFTLLHDIIRNWWMIILGALTGAMLAVVVLTVTYVPAYTTSTTFFVTSSTQESAYSNTSASYEMATTFQKVLESSVMEKIIRENLGTDEVTAQISADVQTDSNLMTLTVTADTAKEAIDVIQIVMDHYDEVALYSVGNAVLTVLQDPYVPTAPSNPLDINTRAKQAALIGAAVMVLLLAVISIMHNTVKNEDEIERKLDARALGAIAYEFKYPSIKESLKRKKKAALVDDTMAGFRFVESTKKLATAVQYRLAKNNGNVLVVSSVAENEGKSTVAANLAITYAKQGKKVILIDADIRKPSQQLIFGIDLTNVVEFSDYLQGNGNIKNVIVPTSYNNLLFIGGEKKVQGSTELFYTDRLGKLIAACRRAADYVIIDTPPAGLIGDAQILGREADGVLVVARQNYILAEDINDVLDDFRDNNCKVLGVALNRVLGFSSLAESPVAGYGRYGYGNYSKYGNYGRYGAYNRQKNGSSEKK